MGVDNLEEDAHVLEARVHALAVEGDHGVCGVAEDHGAGVVGVRGAFDADEWEVRVSAVLGRQVCGGYEVRGDAWEVGFEEGDDGGVVFGVRVHSVEVLCGHEEGACERLVCGGDGDEHEFAGWGWPDV